MRVHTLSIAVVAVCLSSLLGGCTTNSKDPPKMSLLQKGMTIQQVENILGEPLFITPKNVGNPEEDIRDYAGDGDETIILVYTGGVVTEIRNMIFKK